MNLLGPRSRRSIGLALFSAAVSLTTAASKTSVMSSREAQASGWTPRSASPESVGHRRVILPEVCFAPGTPVEVMRQYADRRNFIDSLEAPSYEFPDANRWDTTATDGGGLTQGQVTTLTWNIVPDGTPIAATAGRPSESNAPSNLKAFLTGIYGSEAAWLQHFQTVFDRWGALTGVTYVKVNYDDGASLANGGVFPYNPGVLNTRADVRIGGHFIDGGGPSVLAYNYFPEVGDMVIDTGDTYYSNPGGGLANGSLGLRNIVAHEHGHGLGIRHSCPINNTKLMEPTLSTAFVHAQLDDKLAGWRGYGDDKEDNETAGTASNLGVLGNGVTSTIDLSADDDADVDFYKFTVAAGKRAALTLTPIGSTYLAGPQNGDGSCSAGASFNALAVNDLGIELRDADGTSVLASANAFAAGLAESIPATSLGGAGTYFVRAFAGPVNSAQGYQLAVTISDDSVNVSINDVTVTEGDSGTVSAVFTATLSAASIQTVTVSAVTSNGTAIAPGDYAATGPQTLTFAPSVTTQTFTVLVNGDTQVEGDETFTVTLSNPTNAIIADGAGVGTILNDDGVTVWDAVASEGYVSTGVMKFLVSRAATATGPGTVEYVTTGGTATEPSDYLPASGTLTFANGERRKFIDVTIKGDKVEELNETFTLTLFNPVGFTLARSVATGTILNDDEATLRVTDAKSWDWTGNKFGEGSGAGQSDLRFNIWTSKILYDRDIFVNYTTLNGTATSGSDYTAMSGTVMIARGTAVQQVIVPVVRDSNVESDETVTFRLSNAINASIYKSDGLGTVVADDGLVVSIGDKSLTEGNSGTSPMVFTATLNQSPVVPVTVNWSTVEGSAIAPDDFVTANGLITFAANQTTQTIMVQVVGDAVAEPYETFSVVLSSPGGGAILGDAEGTGTIVNTDGISDRFRLMFHNLADNHLYRWHFKKEVVGSPSLETFNWVTPWGPDPAWHIGAIADFDRDGNLDYLWHNYTTGQMLFWYIDGDNLKGFKFQNYLMFSPWRVATTMDANGDGELDVVYYNDQTGVLKVVLCENGNQLNPLLNYDLATTLPPSEPWRVATASDVNGDGADDLILYNSSTGAIKAWQLTGLNRTEIPYAGLLQGTPDQFRLVSARADFNADGKPDFLWHNTVTGFFMTWSMDGTTRLGIGTFASPFDRTDPTWRLVGAATLWP